MSVVLSSSRENRGETAMDLGSTAATSVKRAKPKRKHPDSKRADRMRRHFDVMARHEFRCAYCDQDIVRDLATFLGMTFDHFKPKSKGGTLEPDNVVICCASCNFLKSCSQPLTIEEARALVQARRRRFLHVFHEAQHRASERRHKPTMLSRLVRRLKGGASVASISAEEFR